ncbi:hypothetical protein EVU96_13980 [Bacillus infantis]|uniref:hypothetical protein n=1 Tax=Bacillus infantis TaxID=324767 RepID=UPI00101C483E|nr:hypothetical protein [Bacillus infantis]RYI28285.1 hypothetical protein EVU96_13980 [Bacillus infantis]
MPKRTTPYITQFFNRDKLAFTTLSKCGHLTTAQLKQCGLTDSRIKNYIRDGLVEKVTFKQGKARTIGEAYKLTKSGRELAERQWALRSHYHAQSPVHDLAIANKYFSLPDHLRETWITETEARDLFQEHLNQMREKGQEETAKLYQDMLEKGVISCPDGLYTNEQGVTVAFETITNNYGEEELQAKEAFVQVMGTQYETTRI